MRKTAVATAVPTPAACSVASRADSAASKAGSVAWTVAPATAVSWLPAPVALCPACRQPVSSRLPGVVATGPRRPGEHVAVAIGEDVVATIRSDLRCPGRLRPSRPEDACDPACAADQKSGRPGLFL